MKKTNLKKNLFLLLSVFILCFSTVFAQRDIKITLDGNILKTDVAPFIKDNRTLVPIRFISEALNYDIKWNEEKQLVTIKNTDQQIDLTINSKNVLVNNTKTTTDVAPAIYNNRTYVPIRFISETFGINVNWNDKTSTVILESNSNSNLSKEEQDYLKNREIYRVNIEKELSELKSYFFENASKYTENEILNKYEEESLNIDKNINKIKDLKVPTRFITSHNLLLEALDFTTDMLPQFKEALIDGNSDASTKIISLLTNNSVKMSEAQKALNCELLEEEYIPDKDIDIYNKTIEQKDKTSDLLDDNTLQGLLERI